MIKRLTQTILLILLTVNLSAQSLSQLQVVGKGKYLASELISKDIRDSNGDVCAAVIISTDLDGLSFDAYNGVVKVNSKPGRHFIFLSPTERVVEVFKSGYEPLKIILNKHGIKLKSGQVWQIKITGDKTTSDLIPVSIISDPAGAEVFIDGENVGVGSTFQLSEGEHEAKFVKKGYKATNQKINVSKDNVLFNIMLKSVELVIATIKTIPTEATIIIDGVEEGKTDSQLFKYPGTFTLRISKSGYLDIEKEIEIKENGNNTFSYNLEKNTASLNLNITPSTAKVLINKKDYSNKKNIELAPGKYQIEINKTGYESRTDFIELELGKTTTKSYSLIQQTGSLQFSAKPIDAKVELKQNGVTKYSWKGAKILKDIPVGNYELTTQANGFNEETKNVNIAKDKRRTEIIELTTSKSTHQNVSANTKGCPSTVTYQDQTYNTVQIGTQCWFSENLNVGAKISNTSSGYQQTNNGTIEKYCYDNNETNCDTYGGLYEWPEAMQYSTIEGTQGICPDGWHIPTKTEYETLETFVENQSVKLIDQSQTMNGYTPTNTTGFSALFAGYRFSNNGSFRLLSHHTYFWSSTENGSSAYDMYLYNDHSDVRFYNGTEYYGFSIRCSKD